jgi:uncharacterized protein (DUF305 family)
MALVYCVAAHWASPPLRLLNGKVNAYPHHQSAIDAARLALRQATRQEIRTLAAAVIADQQREIDQMTSWRQSWYGASAPSQAPQDTPHGTGH